MKNKKENSPTRDKIIEMAERQMLAKGFSATTVDEICQAAGVTKGSFFHYFKSKEDIGKAALERYFIETTKEILNALEAVDGNPLERLEAAIDAFVDLVKRPERRYGCLVTNFALTLAETNPAIHKMTAEYYDAWIELIRLELEQAKYVYAPDSAIDTKTLAENVVALIEGAFILAVSQQDISVFERNIVLYKQFLISLFIKQTDLP